MGGFKTAVLFFAAVCFSAADAGSQAEAGEPACAGPSSEKHSAALLQSKQAQEVAVEAVVGEDSAVKAKGTEDKEAATMASGGSAECGPDAAPKHVCKVWKSRGYCCSGAFVVHVRKSCGTTCSCGRICRR
mmetsp:Transcript_137925/g.428616  ORF Transcript_137925/g.428616 Transcript_137925/m.428616 type:complete len:131 (+) Transcript_137925:69-461(+)